MQVARIGKGNLAPPLDVARAVDRITASRVDASVPAVNIPGIEIEQVANPPVMRLDPTNQI